MAWTRRGNPKQKYSNTRCTCQSGHLHDSRGEARYCDTLQLLKRAKEISDYEIQKSFPLMVNGKTVCRHIVDFLVTGKDGRVWVEEFKGFETDVWKLKHAMFQLCYPDIEYKVIKK